MEDRIRVEYMEVEKNFFEYVFIFQKIWWKVLLLSLAVGIITLVITMLMTKTYRASALITPASEDGKQSVALGALASFGITFGGPTKVEDLETLFKSNDLTTRVFDKHDVWSIVLADYYDQKTGKMKVSWKDRLIGAEKESRPPGKWDAIRAAEDRLQVTVNKKSGTLLISFDTPSPEGSAKIVRYYLEQGKIRLQEEALERASRNKRFLEVQLSKTIDPIIRDRLYTLYSQEVEREMLALNREQYGFKIVDAPLTPDRKAKPKIRLSALIATAASSLIWTVVLGLWMKKRIAMRKDQ
jgi:uncharacterized protein involved in exopolysaccharide biosynthesis